MTTENANIINLLDKALSAELLAVHQYLYHAALLRDWGILKLAADETKEAAEETDHANKFADRILFLGGEPSFSQPHAIKKASSGEEVIKNNLEMELRAVENYKRAIQTCLEHHDFGTQELFTAVLIDEEGHVEHLKQQLALIKQLGIENYLLANKG